MDKGFIDAIQRMAEEHGKEVLVNGKAQKYLADYCRGEYKMEAKVFCEILDYKCGEIIANADNVEERKRQLAARLKDDIFRSPDVTADYLDLLGLILRGNTSKTAKTLEELKAEEEARIKAEAEAKARVEAAAKAQPVPKSPPTQLNPPAKAKSAKIATLFRNKDKVSLLIISYFIFSSGLYITFFGINSESSRNIYLFIIASVIAAIIGVLSTIKRKPIMQVVGLCFLACILHLIPIFGAFILGVFIIILFAIFNFSLPVNIPFVISIILGSLNGLVSFIFNRFIFRSLFD